jgi:prevent-host-death family protein
LVKIKKPNLIGHTWQLQTAKARFSEVFQLARSQGPQVITRQGKDAVVMLPIEQFDRLVVRTRQPESLVKFFIADRRWTASSNGRSLQSHGGFAKHQRFPERASAGL